MSDFDDERARKRRMVDSHDKDDVLRALLREEIDIEIGLRARLKETVESRLTWALILQDALEKHFELPEAHGSKDTPNRFADLAIAAYKATRHSSELFLPSELPEPLSIPENLALAPQSTGPSITPVQEAPRPRHATRPHVQLHHEDRVVKEPNKYLFLRDVTATPTMVYKIACPDCQRSNFPRLQGLLNHCRLKHHREFGSHDECVQACATVVPEEEQSVVIRHGLEVVGMSASLQRLFKMAVGSYEGIVAVPEAEEAEELAKVVQPRSHTKGEEEGREGSTLVTKTLGHHKDTPALAPFLGRAPKKRQIHVFENDAPLDVLSIDDTTSSRVWRKSYTERSRVDETDGDNALSEDEAENTTVPAADPQAILNARGGSRFHIPVRLAVSDWSLRLRDEEAERTRAQGGATHKWMISVATSSYSLHASTVLAKVTVTSATDPPPPTFAAPLSVSGPPFCVMGITDKPFLARITLEWVGAQNKPTQIEHWVELDISKSAQPVQGDEQVLDVELDRHTELLPRKDDSWVIDWFADPNKYLKPAGQRSSDAAEPEHIKRLKKLLQLFPMTAQDVGPRKIPQVPYFLPLTTQHLGGLVEGRRKAIEWGRVRAVWEAYIAFGPEEDSVPQDPQISESITKISGPVDLYRWMEAEGHFLRAASQPRAPNKPYTVPDLFCGFCGLQASAHRRGKGGRVKDAEDGALARVCEQPSWAGRMPIVDVEEFRAHQPQNTRRRLLSEQSNKPSDDAHARLLQVIDPALILGVQRISSELLLPCFPTYQTPIVSGIAPTKEEREKELVPYALLASSVRALVRLLVYGGLQAMETKPEGGTRAAVAGSSGSHGSKKRLLVPVHIVRGLVEGTKRKGSREVHRAVLLSMARLGVTVHDGEPVQIAAGALAPVLVLQTASSAPSLNEAHASEVK